MFNHTDEQCLNGYSGALCLVCAKNYVLQGNDCIECDGGSNFVTALMFLLFISVFIFLVVLCFLLCAPSKKNDSKGKRYFGQVKIIMTFLQILASMPGKFPPQKKTGKQTQKSVH